MRVTNLTSPRSGAKVANQYAITGDGGEYFQSYDSVIAHLTTGEDGLIIVSDDYNYSNTTSRYFKQWLKTWGIEDGEVDKLKKLLSSAQFGQKYNLTIGQFDYTVVLVSDVENAIKYKMYQQTILQQKPVDNRVNR